MFRGGIVLLVLAVRNHDVALEFRVRDFKEPDALVVHFAPGEFRPKAYADAGRYGLLYGAGVVAFECGVCVESDAVAEFVADFAILLGTVKPDELFVFQVG